jgi:hypothetical protein
LTCNILTKGTGKEHLVNSCIFDNGTTTCIKNNLIGTGTIDGTIINSTSNAFRFSGNNAISLVALNAQNVYFTGRASNAAGSFFYILTWLHLMHMVGGLISLSVTAYNASKQKYTPENYLGVKLTAMFWHFLGILWVYLFLFLLYANK